MTDPQPAEPVVAEIELSGATYWRGVLTRAAIFLPLVVVQFSLAARNGLPAGLWWGIVGLVAVAVLVSIALMVTRVRITPSAVRIRRGLGAGKVIPRSELAYGIFVQHYQQFGNRAAPLLVLVGPAGQRKLQLSGQFFSGEDLHRMVTRAGPHFAAVQFDQPARGIGRPFLDVIPGPITAAGVDRRHPGVLSILERHPFRIAAIIVAAIIVIVVVVVAVSMG